MQNIALIALCYLQLFIPRTDSLGVHDDQCINLRFYRSFSSYSLFVAQETGDLALYNFSRDIGGTHAYLLESAPHYVCNTLGDELSSSIACPCVNVDRYHTRLCLQGPSRFYIC